MKKVTLLAAAILASTAFSAATAVAADNNEVTISHYFTGELGLNGIKEIFGGFQAETGIVVKDSKEGASWTKE